MRRFWALYRVLLKCGQGTQEALSNSRKKKTARVASATGEIGKKLLLVVVLGAAMAAVGFAGYESYAGYAAEGMVREATSATMFLGILVMVVGSFPMILSAFFLSKDVNSYIFMPFKPREIVAAKFLTTLSISYLMMLIVVLPQLVGYGIAGGYSAGYYIILAIVCGILPMVPTAYLSVISMALMRIFRKVENKEAWVVIATYAIAVIFIAIQLWPGEDTGFARIINMFMTNPDAAAVLNGIFPNLMFATTALVETDFAMLGLDIAVTVGILVIFMVLADFLYIRGAMGLAEGSGHKRVMSTAKREKISRQTPPKQAYARKEKWMFWRTTTFSMRCLYMAIIMPIVFIGSAALGMPDAIDFGALITNGDGMFFSLSL